MTTPSSASTGTSPTGTAVRPPFSWASLVGLLSLAGVLRSAAGGAVLDDPDTAWHVAAGRWMLEHQTVPSADPFSFTRTGAPWVAHEWLSEVVLAGAHALAGWPGVAALTALVFAATLALLTRFLMERLEPIHGLLAVALTAALLMPSLLARPHLLVWPLCAIWTMGLVEAVEAGRPPPWWLVVLVGLWANLHGSFPIAFVIAVPLALEAVLDQPLEARPRAAGQWAAFGLVALLLSLATPHGWLGWRHAFQVTAMPVSLTAITEWQAPDFQRGDPLEPWLLLLLTLALAGQVLLRPTRILLLLGLVHLSLRHGRHGAVLALVAPALLATSLGRLREARASSGRSAGRLDRWFRALARPARPGPTLVVGLLVLGQCLRGRDYRPAMEAPLDAALQAVGPAASRVLNAYDLGGPLIFRRIPVFIDGRNDLYGDEFLRRYLEGVMLKDRASFTSLLDGHAIGWTLLQPGTPAIAVLDGLPGWRRVYSDRSVVAHRRDQAATSDP